MNKGLSYNKFNETDTETLQISNLELNDDDKEKVCNVIKELKDDKGMNAYEKGKKLENLIKDILLATKVFKCLDNRNTTSNEFDILVKLNTNGKNLRHKRIIPEWIPDCFLIECKNHKEHVKVDLVGKFYSLMDVSNINLGIFISRIGISGSKDRYWNNAEAFVKKINLKYSESSNPKILLDLNLDDIEEVTKDGMNIIEVIETRKINIDMDINSSVNEWITKHENEGFF
ncbi:hypothetical protein CF060_08450 [Clostridium botulinum]|uniref:restriction endonuclease n=1 Tax=Clostridium botulinum TaxID=1491 RepID=UPI000C788D11|nr:restriction endonuclease [Clostridium botulinum]AUN00118.1 hypothetical protein RSJ13_14320 [Clostridium botulinum]QDY29935.1 hypothetical protein CGQ41_14400 [Clostridium botulinum]